NRRSPILTTLVEPQFADSGGASASAVARIVPQIPFLLRHRDSLRPRLVADLDRIAERYDAFLTRHDFFEPSWELSRRVELDHIRRRPVIMWSELLEDYAEYEALLAGGVETVPLTTADRTARADLTVMRYRSSREEIVAAFDAVERALDAGTPINRIVVTVADLEELRPWIEAEAARRAVPLRFAVGDTLTAQPGGRIFGAVQEALTGDLGVIPVSSLLGDRSVPWKRQDVNTLLVRFGYVAHCYNARRWDEAFGAAEELLSDDSAGRGERAELFCTAPQLRLLRARWLTFERDVRSISSARSAASLRRALRRFLDNHIEGAGHPRWTDYGGRVERVYETAITELASIISLEERGVPILRPWTFFLEALAERRYVYRQSGAAVTIYPYRVAAGVPADLHCVIGLSHTATRVRSAPPVGFRRDELRRMGWSGRDRSLPFLRAYAALLPGSRLSCADAGPTGAYVPAADLTPTSERPLPVPTSAWEHERAWWRVPTSPPPDSLYRPQRAGLERALDTTLDPVRIDFRKTHVADEEIRSALAPPETLSPASIDRYVACPFSFFVRDVLRVRRGEYGFVPDGNRRLGTILHTVLAKLLSHPPADRGDRITEALVHEFDTPASRLFLFPAGRRARIEYLSRAIRTLLQDPLFASPRGGSEVSLSASINGVALRGFADRVIGPIGSVAASEAEDGVTIVDYKLTLRGEHSRTGVFGVDGTGPLECRTLQLPLYALLTERQFDVHVERLVYVDLKKASIRVIADERADGRRWQARRGFEMYGELAARLPAFLGETRRSIRTGRFMCREEPDCGRCGIRSICRSCFVTRRYGDG
ncbi:MAG: PD-(D/E)XK nuclease family protein, partial [Spirochaetales bacterium]|nr:PD-(D/E)XK nuclease family protein [Spirochaetales bacterium]